MRITVVLFTILGALLCGQAWSAQAPPPADSGPPVVWLPSAPGGIPAKVLYRIKLTLYQGGEVVSETELPVSAGFIASMDRVRQKTGEGPVLPVNFPTERSLCSTYITAGMFDPEKVPDQLGMMQGDPLSLAAYRASAHFRLGELYLSIYDIRADRFELTLDKNVAPGGLIAPEFGEAPQFVMPMFDFVPWGSLSGSLDPAAAGRMELYTPAGHPVPE